MLMVKRRIIALGTAAVVFCGIQMMGQTQTLVVEGGTLIDGTGRDPISNAVVVIEGNRIRAIGTKGKVKYPSKAKLINAEGKTILPGLIDAHVHYADWQPPIWLHYGFTTIYTMAEDTKWMTEQKETQKKGIFQGPRMFNTGSVINGPVSNMRPDWRHGVKLWPYGDSVATPEEAVADVRKHVEEGADFIHVFEAITDAQMTSMSEEAHKHGIKIGGHSENSREAVEAGMDIIVHMNGVERALMPSHATELKEMKEKDFARYWPSAVGNYQYWMEPAQFDSLIQFLVKRNIPIDPTLAHTWWAWGTAVPHSKQWAAEIVQFAKSNASSLAFVPQKVREQWLEAENTSKRVNPARAIGDQVDATHPTDLEGYKKENEFLKRFVKAGGKIIAGADNSDNLTPGLCTNQEMEVLVGAGLTPMQVIMSVTKWPSEAWKTDIAKDLGTIEVGKLADLITVNGNPLRNIRAMRDVDLVVLNGKIVDTTLDPNWKNPLPQPRHAAAVEQ
jgi:amidohydrolase family protein